MERVWEELKRIENEAVLINSEASNKSKEIIETAKQKGAKLTADSEKYALEEAQRLVEKINEEANEERKKTLEENKKNIEALRETATTHMDEAVKTIFNSLVGQRKV